MKRFLALAVVVAALATFTTTADAGHRGWRSHGWRGSHGFHRRFVSPRRVHGFHGCYPRVHSVWHDTSHYDYHPGEYVRHGNHYDYIPGHWDYHRTGHWDTHIHH